MYAYFDPYRDTLFGHRYIDCFREVDEELDRVLNELVLKHPYIDFYIGNDGDFDRMATSAIRRLIQRCGKENITINLVFAYPKADIDMLEKQFDSVIIPPTLHHVHPKAAIKKRNEWMVEQAQLLLCYVEKQSGGAYTAMKYAERLGKEIINLATPITETF